MNGNISLIFNFRTFTMKLLLYSALFLMPFFGFAQTNNALNPVRETIFYAKDGNPDWLILREGVQITAADLLRGHKTDLGLTEYDELIWYRTDTDDLGFAHHRYRQYHRGVVIDGGEWLIHEKNGLVKTMNGKLVRGMQPGNVQAGLTPEDAIKRALIHLPAERYMWEDAGAETMLRHVHNDRDATFYPAPELVLASAAAVRNPESFRLAWRFIVYAQQPQSRKLVYVDAANGQILDEMEMLCSQNTPGTAQTKYSGEREIVTESIDTNLFRLVETTRGFGIETYNAQKSTSVGNATDFTDQDNHWNNVNGSQDEAATDAHWGAEMTYDYFYEKHGYKSLNNKDMPLITYVHYDNKWVNAQWTGGWAQFGDGDGTDYSALTSLDVVGHEFTHGLTDFTADLRYRDESGALNESFSDIFGAAIEFWADPDNSDWLMGEDFHITGSAFRNMADPNDEGDPDTYKGKSWATGTGDNGGVHTNSGVQNFWFYLMAEGGTGSNDNGDYYDVEGLGLDGAALIAFRNLRFYLAELSTYADAREGALQAAEDIYGPCSEVYKTTANAWYAAGVGAAVYDYDLRALQISDPAAPIACGFSDSETISVQLRYADCSFDLQPGDQIPLAYQINNEPMVWDTLTLSSTLAAGDTLNFTFSIPTAAFATPGQYTIRCMAALGSDINWKNNAVTILVESVANQNADMRLQNVSNLSSGCFLDTATPAVEIGYFGCDSIAAGEPVTVFFSVNGGVPESETFQLPNTLHLGESFQYFLKNPIDLSTQGAYDVKAWVQYAPDMLTGNDSISDLRIVNPLPLYVENVITFEAEQGSLDSAYTSAGREAQAFVSTQAARSGAFGFQMTGGNGPAALQNGEAQLPTQDNVWNINEQFQSKICICADLSNVTDADLRFDRKQTYASYYKQTFGSNNAFGSSLQVLINGVSTGALYKPASQSIDPWFPQKISLKDYLGSSVEICFQANTLIAPLYDSSGIGDKVLLDNIKITGTVTATHDPATPAPVWLVMPNPGKGLFTIAYQAPASVDLPIDVVDALGRTVRSQIKAVSQGANLIPLNLEGAAPGIYFLRVGGQTGKIMVE